MSADPILVDRLSSGTEPAGRILQSDGAGGLEWTDSALGGCFDPHEVLEFRLIGDRRLAVEREEIRGIVQPPEPLGDSARAKAQRDANVQGVMHTTFGSFELLTTFDEAVRIWKGA
jgi:hypothetical protein